MKPKDQALRVWGDLACFSQAGDEGGALQLPAHNPLRCQGNL